MGIANQPTLSIESIAQQEQHNTNMANMEQSSITTDAGISVGESSSLMEPLDQPITTVIKINEKIGNLDIQESIENLYYILYIYQRDKFKMKISSSHEYFSNFLFFRTK